MDRTVIMPRKMNLPFDDVVDAIDVNKNTIFDEHQNMIVDPTHLIWADIKQQLNGEISQKSLYTIVKCNRNDVLSKINIKPRDDGLKDKEITAVNNDSSDFEIEESSKNDTEKTNFKITLSKEEWTAIQSEKKSINQIIQKTSNANITF